LQVSIPFLAENVKDDVVHEFQFSISTGD
jgi:hypothetical protein